MSSELISVDVWLDSIATVSLLPALALEISAKKMLTANQQSILFLNFQLRIEAT